MTREVDARFEIDSSYIHTFLEPLHCLYCCSCPFDLTYFFFELFFFLCTPVPKLRILKGSSPALESPIRLLDLLVSLCFEHHHISNSQLDGPLFKLTASSI